MMAKVTGRQAMLVLVGALDAIFGIVFILLGAESVERFNHGAVGVPMWAGIGLIMVGIGNVLAVLTSSKKKHSPDNLNINFGSLVLNLTGMILATLVIGFYTWGAWDALQASADLASIYSTVILMAVVVFILSLMAMFMDCCSYALFGGAPKAGDYGPPRPRGAMFDDPYGMPPPHMYRP